MKAVPVLPAEHHWYTFTRMKLSGVLAQAAFLLAQEQLNTQSTGPGMGRGKEYPLIIDR